MKQTALIVVILLGLIFLGKMIRNEPSKQEPDEIDVQAESNTDTSTSDSTSAPPPNEFDAAAVERKFAVYRESFFELDRRVLLANQGRNLREHLLGMSRQEQTEYARNLVRCASYFNSRRRMTDGFDDPELDMRFGILSSNFHDTAVSVASVASGNSGGNPLDLLNREKEVFRSDLRELLEARDTQRLERFKSTEEHKCLRLFDWMRDEG